MIVKPLNLKNLDYLMLNINVYSKENKNLHINNLLLLKKNNNLPMMMMMMMMIKHLLLVNLEK